MSKEITIYYGWIGGKESDRATLESFGVKVGPHDHEIEAFNRCEVTIEALNKLEKHWWGKWVWGLIPKKVTVYDPVTDEDVPF